MSCPPSKPPTVTTYVNRSTGVWHANVYWPSEKRRFRPSLGVPADADPSEALEVFKRDILPDIDAAHQVRAIPAPDPIGNGGGPRLRDLQAWYLDTHLPFLGRAQKTIANCRCIISGFVEFCASRHVGRAGQLSWRIIQEWQTWLATARPLAETAKRTDLLVVRHWLSECQDAGELPELPPIKWKIPGKSRTSRFRALSAEELAEFLAGVEEHAPEIAPVMQWTAATGWRISDVLDLRWGEINKKRRIIDREQIKTASRLPYPLTPALEAILNRVQPDKPAATDHVFLNPVGEPWTYQALKKRVEYFCEKRFGGVNVSPRDLRKTFGSLQAMGGCPPNVLKELMGHKDVALTLTYYVDVDYSKMAEWSEKYLEALKKTTENLMDTVSLRT